MGLFRRRRPQPRDHVHPETREQWDAQEQDWRDLLAEHGWMAMDVTEDDQGPGFPYTVGLRRTSRPRSSHVLDADPTLRGLARGLPQGTDAERDEVGGPWRTSPHVDG